MLDGKEVVPVNSNSTLTEKPACITEVEEDLKLKINEANEIQEKLQKEGPTMSDEEKMEAQNGDFAWEVLQKLKNEG